MYKKEVVKIRIKKEIKIILVLTLLLIFCAALTLAANELVVDAATGNVGIGTGSPGQKLHIQDGSLLINNTPTQPAIQIYRSDANQLRAAIDGYGRAVFGYWGLPNTGQAAGTTFYILAGGYTVVPLKIAGAGSSHTGNLFEVWRDGSIQRFVIDTSGNVGIGTAGPSYPIDVHGDDNVIIRALSTDSNSTAGFVMQNDATTWQFIVEGSLSDAFLMRTAGKGLTVTTSGWLGINDGSPDTLLSLQHTDATVFSAISSISQGYAIRNAASVDNSFSSMTFLNSDATSSMAYGTISAVTPFANRVDFVFSMEDGATIAERVRFTGSGNVGIGTSSPGTDLQVGDGTGQEVVKILSGNTAADSTLTPILSLFSQGNKEAFMGIGGTSLYIGNTAGLANYNSTSLAAGADITIDSAGEVGIGTSIPDTMLMIKGDYDASTSFPTTNPNKGLTIAKESGVASDWSFGDLFGITFTTAGNSVTDFPIAGIYGNATDVSSYLGGDLHFATKTENDASLISRMMIDSAGNVGIGTTNPGYTLEVNGNIYATGDITCGGSCGDGDGGGGGTGIWNRSGTNVYLNNTGDSVGIGTSAPGALLDVFDGAGDHIRISPGDATPRTQLTFRSTGAGTAHIDSGKALLINYNVGNQAGSRNFQIRHSSSLTPVFTITGGTDQTIGNVGIGTSSPGTPLEVDGTITINTTGATSLLSIRGETNRDAKIDFIEGIYTRGSIRSEGSDNKFYIDGGYGLILNSAGGNVGIGTDAPGNVLHLWDDIGAGADNLDILRLHRYATDKATDQSIGLSFYLQDDNNNPAAGYHSSIKTIIKNGGAAAGEKQGNLLFSVVNDATVTEAMYIQYDGNVGIGTDSPGAKLEVYDTTAAVIQSLSGSKGGAIIQNIIDADSSYDRAVFSHNAWWDTSTNLWNVDAIGANDAQAILIKNSGGFEFIVHSSTENVARTFSHADFLAGSRMSLSAAGNLQIDGDLTITGNSLYDSGADTFWEVGSCGANTGVTGITAEGGITCEADSAHTVAGDLDHGGLGGLGDDDHTQYTLNNEVTDLGTVSFTSSTTTALFITELESKGAFDNYHSIMKATWSYSGNDDISDTGFGAFELAGTVVETWTDNADDVTRGNIHVRVTRPTTGSGGGQILVYNDQGAGYSPGWRQIWTSTTDGTGSGLDADKLDNIDSLSFLRSDAADVYNDAGASIDLRFEGDTDQNLLFLDASADSVGIGVPAPLRSLHVKDFMRIGPYDNSLVEVFGSGSTVIGKLQTVGTTNVQIGSQSNHDLTLITNNVAKVTVKTDGNVGIGIADPGTNKLYVAGTSYFSGAMAIRVDTDDSMFSIGNPGDLSVMFKIDAAGNDFHIDTNVYSDTIVIDGPTGNIGIGTASPGATLDIATGGLNVGNVGTNAAAGDIAVASEIRVGINDGTYLFLSESYVNAAPTGSNLILNSVGGNVLIGTTTPDSYAHKLYVYDTSNTGAIHGECSRVNCDGLFGEGTSSGSFGVYAYGVTYGVEGYSPSGRGIHGRSTSGYAGYMSGNFHVTGACTGPSGSCDADIAEKWVSEKALKHIHCGEDRFNYTNKTIRDEEKDSWEYKCIFDQDFELEFEQGDVVCFDRAMDSVTVIKYCEKSYDKTALSTLSYNATMIIGAEYYPYPVSLAGNIPVKVICNNPIEVGDTLVTSNEQGYAMKLDISDVTTFKQFQERNDAVFAKALEPCDSGRKTIRAWI